MKHFVFFIIVLIFLTSCNQRSNDKTEFSNSPRPAQPVIEKVISDSTNTLENKVQTLKLQYTVFGCACASWSLVLDESKLSDSSFSKRQFFIEPADSNLYFPEDDSSFDIENENILVTGQFYLNDDYPHPTYEMEEQLDRAKVFRYTDIKRVKIH